MILLDLDPNVVKPGWIPLLITVGLALVMVLLFRSMRRQFSRVHANFPDPRAGSPTSAAPAEERTDHPAPDTPVAGPAGDGQVPGR